MTFKIDYDNQPKKFLKNQDKVLAKRIMDKVDLLITNPVPHDSKRMQGHKEQTFRIRIGKYRVIYRINYGSNLIIVVKIDNREKVYDWILKIQIN